MSHEDVAATLHALAEATKHNTEQIGTIIEMFAAVAAALATTQAHQAECARRIKLLESKVLR